MQAILCFFLGSIFGLPLSIAGDGTSPIYRFITHTHSTMIAEKHDLFCGKIRKAGESEFQFFRAFPELFYSQLRSQTAAEKLNRTKEILIVGDVHVKNIELVQHDGKLVPQFDDFDHSDLAPVALDIARMLTGACFLREKSSMRCSELVQEARDAYRSALGLDFPGWIKTLGNEDSVSEFKTEDLDWIKKAGAPFPLSASRKIAVAIGLDPLKWHAFDYSRGGLSSIGLDRAVFISPVPNPSYSFVFDFKPSIRSGLLFFTKQPPKLGGLERIQKAYRFLRKTPTDARGVNFENRDWLVRHRGNKNISLRYSHGASSVRVMAGLLAQTHLGQATKEPLKDALSVVDDPLVRDMALNMVHGHKELQKLLDENVWECQPETIERAPGRSAWALSPAARSLYKEK